MGVPVYEYVLTQSVKIMVKLLNLEPRIPTTWDNPGLSTVRATPHGKSTYRLNFHIICGPVAGGLGDKQIWDLTSCE